MPHALHVRRVEDELGTLVVASVPDVVRRQHGIVEFVVIRGDKRPRRCIARRGSDLMLKEEARQFES